MGELMVLTMRNFSQTLQQHEMVVVDFWAEWCGPCKNFTQIMQQLAGEYPQVLFTQVDIDKETELAKDFQIMSVPFVMIVRHQTVVYAEAGLLSVGALKQLIDDALALKPDDVKK